MQLLQWPNEKELSRCYRCTTIRRGVGERKDANRTREAGSLDKIQGVVANTLNAFRNGAVGFIDWLDALRVNLADRSIDPLSLGCKPEQAGDIVSATRGVCQT